MSANDMSEFQDSLLHSLEAKGAKHLSNPAQKAFSEIQIKHKVNGSPWFCPFYTPEISGCQTIEFPRNENLCYLKVFASHSIFFLCAYFLHPTFLWIRVPWVMFFCSVKVCWFNSYQILLWLTTPYKISIIAIFDMFSMLNEYSLGKINNREEIR